MTSLVPYKRVQWEPEEDWVKKLQEKEEKYNAELSRINEERAAALDAVFPEVRRHFEETYARVATECGWSSSLEFRKEIEDRVNYYYTMSRFRQHMNHSLLRADKPSAQLLAKRKKCISCKLPEACEVHTSLTPQQYAQIFADAKKSFAEKMIIEASDALHGVLKNKIAMEKEHRAWVEEQKMADVQKEIAYQDEGSARRDRWPSIKGCEQCREMDFTELCGTHNERLAAMKEELTEKRRAVI